MEAEALILAAGSQKRWNETGGPGKKQLVEVGDGTLIERIQDQFGGIVVTNDSEIIDHSSFYFRPAVYDCTLDTLLETVDLWEGQQIILLGDVYYSDQAVQTIKNYRGKCVFFGTTSEIFAISFNDHTKVVEAITGIHGKLWQFYRSYCKIGLHENCITKNFVFIEDDTQDFDRLEEYEDWMCNNRG